MSTYRPIVPNEQLVHDVAQKVAVRALHDSVNVDQWITAVVNSAFGDSNGSLEERRAYHAAVARRMAVVKPSWPDEQPQDDGDVRAVAALLDEYRGGGTIAECKREFNALAARFAARIAALEARDLEPKTSANRQTGTGVPGTMHLEAFGQAIRQAFGHVAYHVGTSATSKTWRDVDVRLMLPDEEFDALFPGYARGLHIDAFWSLICAAISELGTKRTGLPIDFQIQRTTEANEKYPGFRNPLMLITSNDGPRPALLSARDADPADATGTALSATETSELEFDASAPATKPEGAQRGAQRLCESERDDETGTEQ